MSDLLGPGNDSKNSANIKFILQIFLMKQIISLRMLRDYISDTGCHYLNRKHFKNVIFNTDIKVKNKFLLLKFQHEVLSPREMD